MYERQFGLRENPFSAGHQSKYVYPSREHQEALAHLRFGIENREAFVLITGEVGTGKTTALYDALSEWKSRAVVALITNTALTRSELYEEICMRFGVPLSGTATKPQLIQQLERHLLVVRARGDYAILLIDEAQNLDGGLLEETRLLSNLEAQGHKLLQIFLVGQPELEAMLERPELRQLRQRIAVHYRLRPLSPEETEHYIHHRISVAGGNALTVFPADACVEVHNATHGIPREINTVAAQALLNAFVEDAPSVKPEHVRAIVSDTGFRSVLDRPSVPAATHPATGSAATPSTPMSPPAAVSPVPVSPPHDVPAPTREVRQVPAAAPRAAPQAGPATPASTDAEGHTMAGVRPAGSTESWKSWMDSLAKVPVEPTEEGAEQSNAPDAASAEATEAASAIPTQASAEMSAEEFYAVEEAALRSPIGDEEAEDEYGEQVDEDETEGDEADRNLVEPHEVVNASAESADQPAEAVDGEDPAWLEELARESAMPSARSAPVEAALGADFEAAPGIQWGDATSRSEDFDKARAAEAMGQTAADPAAAKSAEPEPAYMAEARNFAPIPPAAEKPAEPTPVAAAVPVPPAPTPRAEPATARVSAAPQRPIAAAQAIPMRLRERLEAAERVEAADGGRMTGWLIGVAAVAVVAIGVLFAMRLRTQARMEAAGTPGTTNTATAPQTPAAGSPESSTTPSSDGMAGAPKVEAPKAPPVAATPKSTTSTVATTPSPAVKPATTTNRNPTSTSPGTQTPTTPSSAVVAPTVPKPAPKTPVAAPKPAAPKAQYGVSVASFLAESRAQSELARLSASTGVSGRVVATADGDFKVVLGSYPDRTAAENAAGRMIESGKVDEARVVPLGSGTKR